MAEEKKKLTYDELKAYADQTVSQAQKIYKESQNLKKENQALIDEIKAIRMQMNFAEINLAFKALEFKNFFSPEFISKVAKRLEEVLTPNEELAEVQKEEENDEAEVKE